MSPIKTKLRSIQLFKGLALIIASLNFTPIAFGCEYKCNYVMPGGSPTQPGFINVRYDDTSGKLTSFGPVSTGSYGYKDEFKDFGYCDSITNTDGCGLSLNAKDLTVSRSSDKTKMNIVIKGAINDGFITDTPIDYNQSCTITGTTYDARGLTTFELGDSDCIWTQNSEPE